MLLVLVAALAAALVAQDYRAAQREFRLRADLHRLTPTPTRGGDGELALVGDKLVIAFRPRIYRREPGTRFRWRFELVDPSTGAVALSRRDDREVKVPAGDPYNPGYLVVIDRLPPPGEYRARFILSLDEPGNAAGTWSDLSVYEDSVVLPPRGGAGPAGEPPPAPSGSMPD